MKISKIITIVVLILSYILALIVIYQVTKAIFGGTWPTENILVVLAILNLTATLSMMGLLMDTRSKLYELIGWRKGYEKGLHDGRKQK